MEIVSALGICIAATVLAVVLRQYKAEYALAVAAAAGAIVFLSLISSVLEPVLELRDMLFDAGIKASYFTVALKTLGICFITGFISDICRDFGQTALAGWSETVGKCAIFVMSVPILAELLSAAYSFIG